MLTRKIEPDKQAGTGYPTIYITIILAKRDGVIETMYRHAVALVCAADLFTR
jgi:hypothetical protein